MPDQEIQGIYAITPVVQGAWAWADVLACSEALLQGGVRLFQYRQKGMSLSKWSQGAQELGRLCELHGAGLILNDAPALESLSGWPGVIGVHLGKDDMSVRQARAIWGSAFQVGASCYNRAELARKAVDEGADHVAFGALFSSRTKPDAVQADLSLFQEVSDLGVPAVGIGGVQFEHLQILSTAGADAAAVVSALYGETPDPAACLVRAQVWVKEWNRFKA